MEQSVTGLQVRFIYFLLAKFLSFKTSALNYTYVFAIQESKWASWQIMGKLAEDPEI